MLKDSILFIKWICFLLLSCATSKAHDIEMPENAYRYFENRLSYEVSSKTVNGWMQDDVPHEDFTILDVREEKDYQAGHVPGAVNLPHNKYNSFEGDEIAFPELKKEVLYIVICYGGECNQSHMAAKKLSSLGYRVKKLLGGFSHWEKQGYPVETQSCVYLLGYK